MEDNISRNNQFS